MSDAVYGGEMSQHHYFRDFRLTAKWHDFRGCGGGSCSCVKVQGDV